eukprot:2087457-Amphidinium_carterae.1
MTLTKLSQTPLQGRRLRPSVQRLMFHRGALTPVDEPSGLQPLRELLMPASTVTLTRRRGEHDTRPPWSASCCSNKCCRSATVRA